jgi:hypothetical protein
MKPLPYWSESVAESGPPLIQRSWLPTAAARGVARTFGESSAMNVRDSAPVRS